MSTRVYAAPGNVRILAIMVSTLAMLTGSLPICGPEQFPITQRMEEDKCQEIKSP
jgi:hypothetical protein